MQTDPFISFNILCCGHFSNMPTHEMSRSAPLDFLVIYVIGGRGFALSEDDRVEARPGDVLTFRAGQHHHYGAVPNDPWDILWTHFTGPASTSILDRIRQAGEQPPCGSIKVHLGLDPLVIQRFEELVLMDSQVSSDRDLCNGLGWGLFALLTHRLAAAQRCVARDDLALVNYIQVFIRDHLDRPLSLNDLAHAADRPVSQVHRLFRRLFHVSPIRYVIQQRIAHAGLLLTETAMPIKQIAAAVGIDDPYYFSRLFTKVAGQSPTAYRQIGRSEPAPEAPERRTPRAPATTPRHEPRLRVSVAPPPPRRFTCP
jgi:AraC-like DNA-binding protein